VGDARCPEQAKERSGPQRTLCPRRDIFGRRRASVSVYLRILIPLSRNDVTFCRPHRPSQRSVLGKSATAENIIQVIDFIGTGQQDLKPATWEYPKLPRYQAALYPADVDRAATTRGPRYTLRRVPANRCHALRRARPICGRSAIPPCHRGRCRASSRCRPTTSSTARTGPPRRG